MKRRDGMPKRRRSLSKVTPEHSDAMRVVPLHPTAGAEIIAPAVAPHLSYRNGSLIASVEVFTIFWGLTWNSTTQESMMNEINAFFDFVLTSELIDQHGEYNVPGYAITHGKRTGTTVLLSPTLGSSVTDNAIQKMLINEIATNSAFPQPSAN